MRKLKPRRAHLRANFLAFKEISRAWPSTLSAAKLLFNNKNSEDFVSSRSKRPDSLSYRDDTTNTKTCNETLS